MYYVYIYFFVCLYKNIHIRGSFHSLQNLNLFFSFTIYGGMAWRTGRAKPPSKCVGDTVDGSEIRHPPVEVGSLCAIIYRAL